MAFARTSPVNEALLPLLTSSPSIASHSAPRIFARGVATARRTHKALRPPLSSSALPASKYSHPEVNQIVFNPPPSAPSPYHTPPIFLPPQDPRRALLMPSHQRSNPYAYTTDATRSLPPAIREPTESTYHLGKEEIEEIRRLRRSDEWTWTKKKLADKFGCTELFVTMCMPASDTRKEWARVNLERVKERWGQKRRAAREERVKRKELWARDA